MSHDIFVSTERYPVELPDQEWVEGTLRRKQDILARVYHAFRNHDTHVHLDDEMWNGLLVGGDDDTRWTRMHYFYGGRSALNAIGWALNAAGAEPPKRILDFPCGHGRVMRFLTRAFPEAQLYGGDLNRGGVDFCAERFGCEKIYSEPDLTKVMIPGDQDLIWCGSLATHLPEKQCVNLFNMLIDALAKEGIAGITVCSRGMDWAQKNLFKTISDERYTSIERQLADTGFGYADYAGAHGYGMAFVDLRWIQKVLYARKDCYLLAFAEKAWHGAQDIVWVVKRPVSYWYHWAKDY